MSYTVVLKVTDFTHIARFVYFVHIEYNSVVVVVDVIVVEFEVVVVAATAVVMQQVQ
jgi:hypothetical protein